MGSCTLSLADSTEDNLQDLVNSVQFSGGESPDPILDQEDSLLSLSPPKFKYTKRQNTPKQQKTNKGDCSLIKPLSNSQVNSAVPIFATSLPPRSTLKVRSKRERQKQKQKSDAENLPNFSNLI